MSLDKYLKGPQIKKTVDPGSGLGNTPAAAPKELLKDQVIAPTKVETLLRDLQDYGPQIIQKAESAAQQIYELAKDQPTFTTYWDLVQAYRPTIPTSYQITFVKPIERVSYQHVKAAERAVFRQAVDPRTPFIWDLYRVVDEIKMSQYFINGFWQRLTSPNKLYSSYEASRIVRYSLLKEKQYYDMLGGHIDDIQDNLPKKLAACFIKGLVRAVVSHSNQALELGAQVDELIQTLQALESAVIILTTAQHNIIEHWEVFHDNIGRTFGDFISYLGQEAIRQSAYIMFGGLERQLLDFSSTIGSIVEVAAGGGGHCPDLLEFQSQIATAQYKLLAKIEENLIEKERLAAEIDENRAAAILASQKNSRNLQFVKIIEALIQELRALRDRNLLLDLNYTDKLTNSLLAQARLLGKSVMASPNDSALRTTVPTIQVHGLIDTPS